MFGRLVITDSRGRIVYRDELTNRSVTFNIKGLRSGTYAVAIYEIEEWEDGGEPEEDWKPEIIRYARGKFVKL